MDINKPRFELRSIYSDGSAEEPQIVPINEMPLDTNTNRRGFLGAGLVAGAALTLLGKSNLFARSTSNTNPDKYFEDKELYAHCKEIEAISISPDGKILASGSSDETIKIWSLPDGKLLKTLQDNSYIRELCISPDSRILVSRTFDSTIKLWSIPEGALLKVLQGHTSNITVLSVSPDGQILASGSRDNTIKLWHLPSGELFKTLKGHFNLVDHLSFSINNKILASGSFDNNVKLWSIPEGKLLKTLQGHSAGISSLSIISTENILVSGSFDKTIKLWSIPEGNLLKSLEGLNNFVLALSISPDGKILASGSENETTLWSLPEGDLLKTLESDRKGAVTISITPNNRTLIVAAGDYGRNVKLWSLPEGNLLNTLEGHSLYVKEISISPDGKILATGSRDNTIRLWDLEKKEFISFLFDPACNQTKGLIYNVYDKVTNTTRTYTLPCGSPIPSGATCTCNCVAGTYKAPTYSSPTYQNSCSCNKVCTCIPVCQAHKLLDPDKFVRRMSREILLFMGIKELEYMNWAADNSKARLKAIITSLIKKIKRGANPNYRNWPTIKECKQYLNHNDEVISVMAAQMINLQSNLREQVIPEDLFQKVESLLKKSEDMHWENKLKIWI